MEGSQKFEAAVAKFVKGHESYTCTSTEEDVSDIEERDEEPDTDPTQEAKESNGEPETDEPGESHGDVDATPSQPSKKPGHQTKSKKSTKNLEKRTEIEWQKTHMPKLTRKKPRLFDTSSSEKSPKQPPRKPSPKLKKPKLLAPSSEKSPKLPPRKLSPIISTLTKPKLLGSPPSEGESDPEDEQSEFERRRKQNIEANQAMQKFLGLGPSHSAMAQDIANLKERVKALEKSSRRLGRKLEGVTSKIEISPSVQSQPQPPTSAAVSPTVISQAISPAMCVPQKSEDICTPEDVTICGHKVNSLRLAQAKLQAEPSKAALKLLSCLFDPEELVNGNPSGSTNSKDVHRQQTIKKLDAGRMNYLAEYLESKWPGSSQQGDIRRKLTQKCTDMYNDVRYKVLRH